MDLPEWVEYTSPDEFNYFSKKFMMKHMLGLSDADIEENERRWEIENNPTMFMKISKKLKKYSWRN